MKVDRIQLESSKRDVRILEDAVDENTVPFYIVGVGASAGGLEALEQLFINMPSNTGFGFVIIQHLSPDYKSLMVELLSKHTDMQVIKAEDGIAVTPNTVFILPPKKIITIYDGRLELKEKDPKAPINLPIDIFFSSLAKDKGDQAIGIILSGTGSDGTRGVRVIKECGGLIMVQEESSAKFDGMPRSAMATGVVDFVIKPDEMPAELQRYVNQHISRTMHAVQNTMETENDKLNAIFQLVKNQNNIDFSQYKSSTVARRIQRRMDVNRLDSLHDYLQFLVRTPREVTQLCKEMLIGVTNFFRDPQAFKIVKEVILPKLISDRQANDPIRVWCGGCSTGEEAYSLAILFAEVIRDYSKIVEVKIFATDVDREALEFASVGSYPDSVAADIPTDYLKRYFNHINGKYTIHRQIREMIVFAPQNITKDPPFTRMDFIICRNLLIYIQQQLQKKIFSLFRFALKPEGYLFLGGSETIGDYADHFKAVDTKWKIYQLRNDSKRALDDTIRMSIDKQVQILPRAHKRKKANDKEELLESLVRSMLDSQSQSCIVVNEKFQLTYTFGDLQNFISFSSGEATLEILSLVPKDLSLALSTALHRAKKEGKTIIYNGVLLKDGGRNAIVNISVNRLKLANQQQNYFLIFIELVEKETDSDDKESAIDVQAQISQHVTDLENDLNFTRENLQATVEELETSNEELQAANEELLSSNEELQSTNEELQSVNEELFTVNTEYQQKLSEMTELNNDIENLMRCTDIGSVFLDDQLLIRRYTPAVNQYVNIIEKDLGRQFFDLSHKLRYDLLSEDASSVLETQEPMEKEVSHIDGRSVLLKIFPYLDELQNTKGIVINYVDLTVIKDIALELMQMKSEKDIILDSFTDTILYYNSELEVVWANAKAFEVFAKDPETLIGAKHSQVWFNSDKCKGEGPAFDAFESGKPCSHEIEDHAGRKWILEDIPVKDKNKTVRAVVEFARMTKSEVENK